MSHEFSVQKMSESHDNTKAHFTNAGNARVDEFYE